MLHKVIDWRAVLERAALNVAIARKCRAHGRLVYTIFHLAEQRKSAIKLLGMKRDLLQD